jgi:hypothetical protein
VAITNASVLRHVLHLCQIQRLDAEPLVPKLSTEVAKVEVRRPVELRFAMPVEIDYYTLLAAGQTLQQVSHALFVQANQVVAALTVRDNQFAIGTHVGSLRPLRIFARVHEAQGQVRLDALIGLDEVVDQPADIAQILVLGGRVGGHLHRAVHLLQYVHRGFGQSVALVLREIPLRAAVPYQPQNQDGGRDQQHGEDPVLDHELKLQPGAGFHVRSRSASKRRMDSRRNNAVSTA